MMILSILTGSISFLICSLGVYRTTFRGYDKRIETQMEGDLY